ncbi:MAG TPA: lipocalin family protein [Chitinophagaceae bacterium]|nr:lipocalin family protein [Chitinophagaceae bacterium]
MQQPSVYFKTILAFVCLTTAFHVSSFAQSITGKWKLISVTGFLIYKSSGKKLDLSTIKNDQVYTFNADNTYILTNTAGQHPRTGTYSFTPGKLTIQIDTRGFTEEQKKAAEKRAQVAAVQFKSAGTMTWHAVGNDEEYNADAVSTLEKQP